MGLSDTVAAAERTLQQSHMSLIVTITVAEPLMVGVSHALATNTQIINNVELQLQVTTNTSHKNGLTPSSP